MARGAGHLGVLKWSGRRVYIACQSTFHTWQTRQADGLPHKCKERARGGLTGWRKGRRRVRMYL